MMISAEFEKQQAQTLVTQRDQQDQKYQEQHAEGMQKQYFHSEWTYETQQSSQHHTMRQILPALSPPAEAPHPSMEPSPYLYSQQPPEQSVDQTYHGMTSYPNQQVQSLPTHAHQLHTLAPTPDQQQTYPNPQHVSER